MDANEVKERLDVIYWVTNMALISYQRYKKILLDTKMLKLIFPNIRSNNPIITHTIGENGILFKTSKNEVVEEHNYSLFKAWQIVLGIVVMTSILDFYLKQIAEKITGEDISLVGIFDRFPKLTGIKITQLNGFEDLRKYHRVRDISIHNLGRTNEKFLKSIGRFKEPQGSYIYYPVDLKKYYDLIIETVQYI